MSRIIKSLKQAVRYARGDKTAGRLTRVSIPRGQTALEMAKAGAGTWVKNSDMHPTTNVADRVYRKHDGTYGVFYSHDGVRLDFVDAWFFPSAH
jgi:hypothetical protein